LRRAFQPSLVTSSSCQGAPRTCRCIETVSVAAATKASRQGAPRTCRCIETRIMLHSRQRATCQGAPRTCRCIETGCRERRRCHEPRVREHHAPVGALRRQPFTSSSLSRRVREHHAPVGALRRAAACGELSQALAWSQLSGSTTHL